MGIRNRGHTSSHLLANVRNARISLLPVHAPSRLDEGTHHGRVTGHTISDADRHRSTDLEPGAYNSPAITHSRRYASAEPRIEPHAY